LISYCLNSDQIPIIANSIGESINSNEYLYLDINHVTLELAIKFKPLKVINLNYNGGLIDHDEKVKQNLIKIFL
jgi:acetylglutamate kinase